MLLCELETAYSAECRFRAEDERQDGIEEDENLRKAEVELEMKFGPRMELGAAHASRDAMSLRLELKLKRDRDWFKPPLFVGDTVPAEWAMACLACPRLNQSLLLLLIAYGSW